MEPRILSSWLRHRTPHYHAEVPFVVCWSQKSGCTVVLKWFLYHAGLLEEAVRYHTGAGVNSVQRFAAEVLKGNSDYRAVLGEKLASGLPAICFVRCPFERAFSSYLHLHNPLFAENPGLRAPALQLRRKILTQLHGTGVGFEACSHSRAILAGWKMP